MNDITTLKKSLLMIQKLKKLLQEQNDKLFDPIAIIGMSCRLPIANNPRQFWQALCTGENAITAIPDERWELLAGTKESALRNPNMPYWGGYLKDIDAFDAYFFGISPREAMRMDPQQRVLLEVCYEALEDAGLPVERVAGSKMGVFSSLYASQFSHLQQLESDMDALLIPTGSAISIAANRFSYLFDVHGPSLVLDSACSSSLIAVQLACLNLQAKTCDQALVSAVNINLLPSIHSTLAKATMLSPTGQCHTFDAKADGYVQGEGAGAILLKPLSKALRDKDQIYAVIAGAAVNQDGKTNGLTAPNGLQQEALLRAAYQSAKIDPREISYVECHGTGTFLGDPIEIQALGEVVAKQRDKQQPCWISSVKTNVGHLEPAAGIVGMIKAALTLKHGQITPHLNFSQANPHIPFDRYAIRIPTQVESLPRYGDYAVAGVSGFGFGGANAHVVLREHLPAQEIVNNPKREQELFTLSAKDPVALQLLINSWLIYLKENPQLELASLCYNLHLKRSHYAYRCAFVISTIAELQHQLEHFVESEIKKTSKAKKINDFSQMSLPELAEHYVNQAQIDWNAFEADRFYAALTLPAYPWQHKKYWPKLGGSLSESEQTSYPLKGKGLNSPLSTRQFAFHFDSKTLPEVHDTFCVLHAGYYTEMLAFAMKNWQSTTCFSVESLEFLSPLMVMDNKQVQVQLILDPLEANEWSFQFHSDDGQGHWILHAQGKVSTQTAPREQLSTKSEVVARSISSGSAEHFYQRILGMGMPAGDTIRWTDHYWYGEQELFAELRKPKSAERNEEFVLKLHPGIIDACIQTLFLLLPQEITTPYIAAKMGRVEFYDSCAEAKYIYTVIKELAEDGSKILGDWYLLDKNHCLLAKCQDLQMTQLADTLNIEHIMGIQSQIEIDFSLPYEQCKQHIMSYLQEQCALIFSMPLSDMAVDRSLHDFGMDSLMSMAVMRSIENTLGVTYSLPLMMQGPSIEAITEYVLANKGLNLSTPLATSTKEMSTIWLGNRKARKVPEMRLFCFPFGGGGATIYREWQQDFPDTIEICPIQLPGRENRMDEPAMHHLDSLVEILAHELQPLMNIPFAFFGHSFGSLIGFELARYLRRHQLAQPMHLFASAYPDPCQPSKSLHNLIAKLKQMNLDLFALNQEQLNAMSDEQLQTLALVFKDNGIVDYSDERMNKSIVQVLLPIFIGDMNIVKNYSYYEEEALDIPITVFIGQQDTWVAPEDHRGWSKHSQQACQFHEFPSGHLFIREPEYRLAVIKTITQALSTMSELEGIG
ncbi:MAG: polyketide synthase [Legionella sp.]|nr:MAG: polyketide synthase [Legionella sp.]